MTSVWRQQMYVPKLSDDTHMTIYKSEPRMESFYLPPTNDTSTAHETQAVIRAKNEDRTAATVQNQQFLGLVQI